MNWSLILAHVGIVFGAVITGFGNTELATYFVAVGIWSFCAAIYSK